METHGITYQDRGVKLLKLKCTSCGIFHSILYGDKYLCRCGHTGECLKDSLDESSVICFTYKNYKGITAIRNAIPKSLEYKSTKYHPKTQWILTAFDINKEEMRDFALEDCDFAATRST